MTVRVFHLDDHELFRLGIRMLFELEEGLELVGEASNAADALARIPATRPDVALLDTELGEGGSGIEVCREIRSRHPEVQCLILTAFADDKALFSAIMAGAAGYVLKGVKGGALVSAVREVAAGRSLLDPAVTQRVLERLRSRPDDDAIKLTAQEQRILDLIARGCTNREIGTEMFLAEKTVRNYVSNLLTKLGMQRRSEAAAYAARLGERRRAEGTSGPPRSPDPGPAPGA